MLSAEGFIEKWKGVKASELSTSQSFLADLCRLLDVETPHPTPEQDYMFERPITFVQGDGRTSPGRIDLYKRGAFVLESKKLKVQSHAKGFDDALMRARGQAESYARALPSAEGRPPFVVVVDVGNRIQLYSEFSRSGATYTPFPDPRSYQIALDDLRKPEIRERLRKVWVDPLSLDPSSESARVTRDIAMRLAKLARSLEQAGHQPQIVAQFLMRCLFTMFAEDVKLLPSDSFRDLLIKHVEQPDVAMRMLASLWHDMDSGGFSAAIANEVLRFNGKLFKQPDTLPLDKVQLQLLIEAAKADWKHVEPAIFGTLLERALTPNERHKLGAHYTPRTYVERLVLPAVIEPLRMEWSNVQAAAFTLVAENKQSEAIAELCNFHHRLCTVRVLDPACGSGNFLYVTLEHLKRLEGEVLNALDELGYRQTGLALSVERADTTAGETVDPHNLLGIEINPRAAAIAEVVLWIGYLQWHFRTRGDVNPPVPVIRDFRNIENRDALLDYDRVENLLDEHNRQITRWDGVTMKRSSVTDTLIPDDAARVSVQQYINPRKAQWPQVDFVVGNPPFIGASTMRSALGDGYVEALRSTWSDVPESSDFVMHWWHKSAELVSAGALQRFGLITTNSLRQTFNRRVLEPHLNNKRAPLSLVYAIPDHPWVDTADGAAVRIAMTVATGGGKAGKLLQVTSEVDAESQDEVHVTLAERVGLIHADLTVGPNTLVAHAMRANAGLCFEGVKPHGKGFLISEEIAQELGLGTIPGIENHIRHYRNGKDLTESPRGVMILDMYGLTLAEVLAKFPAVYQWLLTRVKPERDQNNRPSRRENWWLFGENYPKMRRSLVGLQRYIATVKTAKYRVFHFLSGDLLHDSKLISVSSDDAFVLGTLSSVVHCIWAVTTGSNLGVGNDPTYVISRCFDPYPFPLATDEQKYRIRNLSERLDAHRKRQLNEHVELTLTNMYNVMDMLRSGAPLSPKERAIHDNGLVSVLRQLHDELDGVVLEAYGWIDLMTLMKIAQGTDRPSENLSQNEARRMFDEAILERLIELNSHRAAEEARGQVQWLRPEFQNSNAQATATQIEIDTGPEAVDGGAAPLQQLPWPKDTIEQVRAVAEVIGSSSIPLSLEDIANRFTARGAWKKRLLPLVTMLVALGRAREQDGQYFSVH